MRQIITLHVGQAGIQIGSSFWQLMCSEHYLNYNGNIDSTQFNLKDIDPGRLQVLFDETRKCKYVPRTFFLDSDPFTIDQVKNREMKNLFHPNKFYTQKQGCCAFFMRGQYALRSKRQQIQNQLRKLIQSCHCLQAIIVFFSISGGTGSGFTSVIQELLKSMNTKIPVINFIVYPSPRYSNLIVQPYNTVFGQAQILKHSDANILFTNQKIYDVCMNHAGIQNPNFANINQVITRVASSITAPQRYSDSYETNLGHMLTNLIPYSRLNFLTASYAPFLKEGQQFTQSHKLSAAQLSNFCFNRNNNLTKYNRSSTQIYNNFGSRVEFIQRQICCSAFYRGQMFSKQVMDSLEHIKTSQTIKLVDWSPTGIQANFTSNQPKPFLKNNYFPTPNRDCCTLINTTAVHDIFKDIWSKYNRLWETRAFIHWYGGYCSNDTFNQARYDYETILRDYQQIS